MLTPLGAEIKEKVIAAFLSGKGRNQISREMHGMVSHGSISNIINAYKKSHSSQPATPNNENSGAELVSVSNNLETESEPIDFEDNPAIADYILDELPYEPRYDFSKGEKRLGIYDVESYNSSAPEEQVQILPPSYNNYAKVTQIEEAPKRSNLRPSTSNPTSEVGVVDKEEVLDIDWNPDDSYRSRWTKRFVEEKHERNVELRQLSSNWQRIKHERQLLEKEKRELSEASEDFYQRASPVRDLLPIADELKRLNVSPSVINTLVTMVIEYASHKMVDEQTAVEDLKNLAIYCDLQKVISEKRHEAELLEMAIEDRKEQIAYFVDLRKEGIAKKEIMELLTEAINSKKNNGHANKEDLSS